MGRRTVSPDTFAASSSCGPTSCLPPPGLAVQLGKTLPQPVPSQVDGVRAAIRIIVAARRGPRRSPDRHHQRLAARTVRVRRCAPDGRRLRCEAKLACAATVVDDHDLRGIGRAS